MQSNSTMSRSLMRPSRPIVCVLSAHLPGRNVKEAGQRIVYDHLKMLAVNNDIILICFANKNERDNIDNSIYELCHQVTIFYVGLLERLLGVLYNPQIPVYIAFRSRRALEKSLNDIRQQYNIKRFWIEYVQMAQYAPTKKSYDEHWSVVCHDVATQLFERKQANSQGIMRILYTYETKRLRSWEKATLKRFNCVLTLSDKDKECLLSYGLRNAITAPPKIAKLCKKPKQRITTTEPTILFIGAMNRTENEDAVLWFLEQIASEIKLSIQTFRFIVVGANPSAKLLGLSKSIDWLDVTGFIKDLTRVFQQAWFSVAPLRIGAGVKLKVLECLSQGLPVVATNVGAEGIDAKECDGLIVADNVVTFADICISLMNDPGKCKHLGRNARDWYLNSYKPREFDEKVIESIWTCEEL